MMQVVLLFFCVNTYKHKRESFHFKFSCQLFIVLLLVRYVMHEALLSIYKTLSKGKALKFCCPLCVCVWMCDHGEKMLFFPPQSNFVQMAENYALLLHLK